MNCRMEKIVLIIIQKLYWFFVYMFGKIKQPYEMNSHHAAIHFSSVEESDATIDAGIESRLGCLELPI